MKKLQKLLLDKQNISKLDDYELSQISGGTRTDLVSCYLCTEVLENHCPPTTTTTKLGSMTSGTGDNPTGPGCEP